MAYNIDVVYYINLDHRDDRKIEFLREMAKTRINNIHRISAIYEKDRGHLGCTKSHIKTLETFINSKYQNCIVFEDDFEFTTDPLVILNEFFKNNINYDVCMLSGNVSDVREISEHNFIKKVYSVQTSSGYMVSKKFAPTLLQNLKEGCEKLEKSYNEGTPEKPYEHYYALDQYWSLNLQPATNWYIFDPKLGKQRRSYSDIDQRIIDLGL